jgi:hypothetical protein
MFPINETKKETIGSIYGKARKTFSHWSYFGVPRQVLDPTHKKASKLFAEFTIGETYRHARKSIGATSAQALIPNSDVVEHLGNGIEE